jgi:hypothetical protein
MSDALKRTEIHDEYCPACKRVTMHDPSVIAVECDACKTLHEPMKIPTPDPGAIKPTVCRWKWDGNGTYWTNCDKAYDADVYEFCMLGNK